MAGVEGEFYAFKIKFVEVGNVMVYSLRIFFNRMESSEDRVKETSIVGVFNVYAASDLCYMFRRGEVCPGTQGGQNRNAIRLSAIPAIAATRSLGLPKFRDDCSGWQKRRLVVL